MDLIFMESYLPTRSMKNIKYIVKKGQSSNCDETKAISKEILNMIPSKRNFIIKNNIVISTTDYIENTIPISKLLCCEGLNNCHLIATNREQHLLIAKVSLYTSTSMF